MLTKIIYKNFRSNFKNYVAFFIGNMMGVTEFFVFWGLYSIVKNMSTNSVMLEDTLEEIIISVSVITIFSTALMVYSMLNYIKKRIADYSLFYILGMKKQKLYVFVFSEYLAGWMVSLLIGLGIGRGILYLIQQIWHKLFPTYISLCSVGTEIYFNTCKISFFIMLAVVFVLLIWADNSGISRMIAGNEIKEKRPKSIYWSICIVIGGGLLILGYWSYPNNTFTGYVLSHVEWIMGGFLILIFGGGILLEIIHSHLKFYLKNLLKLNQLYSKYQTNVLVLLMFLSLHFIALSYCTANVCELLPINGHEKYYPYQAIWMNRGEKGDISFSETLSHSYNGKNGKKVYVVHQQDRATKAQPVDWYYNKKTPTLHIGLPCEYCDYADHETTYDKKIVAGEEISSLTGCYSTPKCENLIVFSDEYFKKAQNEWKDIEALTGFKLERYKAMYGDDGEPYIIEGPTKLVFIQTDKKYIDQIDKELESKEERHKYIGNYDSTVKFHYLSKAAITDMKTERAVKSMICVYIIITLSILNWIMLYAMNEMEKKEKAEREKFLVSMGMDRKERKKMNKREWYIYWIVPTIILIISTILFMRDTMTARMYPDDIRKICELQEAVVIAVWIVINGIYFWIMNRKARRG